MAAEVFQKGNRPKPTSNVRAVYYAVGAVTSASTVAANSILTINVTVPFKFQGEGQVEATLPPNDALDTGLSLGGATLIAPASGSYSAGNHPRAAVQIINVTGSTITFAGAHDIVLTQY